MSEETNQLKRHCRKTEQKWRKSKLQVHYDILRTTRNAKWGHFITITNENNLSALLDH
jgi:hypothetical protein